MKPRPTGLPVEEPDQKEGGLARDMLAGGGEGRHWTRLHLDRAAPRGPQGGAQLVAALSQSLEVYDFMGADPRD